MFTAWQPKDEDPLILVAVRKGALAGAYRRLARLNPLCESGALGLAERAHGLATEALNELLGGCGEMTQSHLPTPSGPEGGLWDR